MQMRWIILVVAGGAILTVFVAAVIAYLSVLGPWLKAMASGAAVPVFEIIGMQLRRIPPTRIIDALIAARQGGLSVSCADLQRAHLRGVDVQRLVLAAGEAKNRELDLTWDDLVEADLSGQLAKRLGK